MLEIPKRGQICMKWVRDDLSKKDKNTSKQKKKKDAIFLISPDIGSCAHSRHIRKLALEIHA